MQDRVNLGLTREQAEILQRALEDSIPAAAHRDEAIDRQDLLHRVRWRASRRWGADYQPHPEHDPVTPGR